ncbi:MAG: glycosyltransferase [Spirochaetes bacterium]|nr:MAG: glycosyltransferase [Spirochaetota bacterium]
MPLFSVVIPTYNRADLTRRAVASVLDQDFDDYELILVDDGSTDGTPALERAFAGRLTYLRRDNGGVSAARNAGIRAARGTHLAFLDSDDQWLPGALRAHDSFIRANPGIRIHQAEEIWVRGGRRVNPKGRHRKPGGDIFLRALELCLVSPSAVVMERGLFDEYGMFDEALPVCEDYDMWLRVSAHERVGLIPEPFVLKYGGHPDQLSRSVWGLDRYRVYAILKLLGRGADTLKPGYARAARDVARKKCGILAAGAVKRGNLALARAAQQAISALEDGRCSSIDPAILVRE